MSSRDSEAGQEQPENVGWYEPAIRALMTIRHPMGERRLLFRAVATHHLYCGWDGELDEIEAQIGEWLTADVEAQAEESLGRNPAGIAGFFGKLPYRLEPPFDFLRLRWRDQEQSGFRADALIHIHRELVGGSARIQMHLHSVYRSLEELQLTYIDAVLWLELQAAMDAQACFGDDFFRSKDLRRNLGHLRRKAPSMAMHVEAFEVALGKLGGVEQVPRLLFDDVGRVLRETKAIVSYSGTLQAMDIWRSMAIKHCQAHAFSQLKRVFDLLETERTGRAPGPRDGASTVAQWVDAIVSLYLGRPTLKPVPVELGPVDGSAARVPKAASTLLKERLAVMGFTGERVTKALEKKALIRMYANSAKSQEIYFRFQLTWMVLGYPSDEFREHFEEPPRPLPPDSQPEDYRSETITDSDAESVRSQPTPDGRPPK